MSEDFGFSVCERVFRLPDVSPPSLGARTASRVHAVEEILQWLAIAGGRLVRQERKTLPTFKIVPKADTTSFITSLYEENLLIITPVAVAVGLDKLMAADLFRGVLGEQTYSQYFAKTYGFFEFVRGLDLVDDATLLSVSKSDFIWRMREAFPEGLVFKETNSAEGRETKRIFFKEAAIEKMYEILSNQSRLRRWSSGTTVLADGNAVKITAEKYLVQELLPGFHDSAVKMQEYRLHTMEDKVVPGATFSRWANSPFPVDALDVERQLNELLVKLPPALLRGLALSFDVLVTPAGKIKIVEINAPTSRESGWSGYLANPIALGAYARFLESEYNLALSGWDGLRLKTGTANIRGGVERLREKMKGNLGRAK